MAFVTGSLHLACLRGLPTSQRTSVLNSFLRLYNVPLYGFTTICLFIHPLTDLGLFSIVSVITDNTVMNIHVQIFA